MLKIYRYVSRLFWPAIVIIIIVAGSILYYYYTFSHVRDAYLYTRYATISPRVAGHVNNIFVKNNELVKKGQKLFTLDAQPYQLQYNQAASDLASNEQKVKLYKQTLEFDQANIKLALQDKVLSEKKVTRYKSLLKRGVVSAQTYDGVMQEYLRKKSTVSLKKQQYSVDANQRDYARKRLQQSQAKLKLEKYELKQTKIIAPVTGFVTNMQIQLGDVLQVQNTAMVLVPTQNWWVIAETKEYVLRGLSLGQKVEFTTSLTGGKEFSGTIASIGYGIRRDLNNNDGLAYVDATVDWIRLDKRFPVWIKVNENTNTKAFRVGADAKVWY